MQLAPPAALQGPTRTHTLLIAETQRRRGTETEGLFSDPENASVSVSLRLCVSALR